MRVAMLTNTCLPHVGGVARSIDAFKGELQKRDHQVLIIAPEYDDMVHDPAVVRIRSLRHFSDGTFSVPGPFPGTVGRALNRFRP